MKRWRVFSLALMAVLALTAITASLAQAASPEWSIEGKALSGSESISSEATETFKLEVPARGLTIQCTEQSTVEGKITSPRADSGKISFNNCSVVGAPTCKVTQPITTVPLVTELKLSGTTVYDTFKPASGTTFTTITISGCAAAGSFPITGQTCGKATNALGVQAVKQQLEFSKAITATCIANGYITGGLKFAGTEATLTGKANNFLSGANAGKKFGAI